MMTAISSRAAAASASVLFAAGPLLANPNGADVVAGQATIHQHGAKLDVFQATNKAIINWQSFDIAPDEHTQFHQTNASSITLNRVTGGQSPSQIFGQLSANGRVLIINPDGVLFGPQSRVDVAGLVVTTHDIRNEDFLAGRYLFTVPGKPTASIVNLGAITVADHGIAALVAPAVRNAGTISARLGKVSLAAGNTFTLDLYGDNLVSLAVADEITHAVVDAATGKPVSSLLSNKGKLSADGGTVALSAATARAAVDSVINTSGIIEARSIGRSNGKIILGAQTAASKGAQAPTQRMKVSGTLDASGKKTGEVGGTIVVLGEDITLAGTLLDASGAAGGGKVLVGGDFGGGSPVLDQMVLEGTSIPTATSVRAGRDVTVDVSAIESGDGGKAVAWADRDMTFGASIVGRGGPLGGDGGLVEVSGKKQLDFAGMTADLAAPKGTSGLVLLDPDFDGDEEINTQLIDQPQADAISAFLNTGTSVMIWTGDLQFVNNDYEIVVGGNILKTAGGDAILQFVTGAAVRILPGIVIGSSHGKLDVIFNFDGGIDEDMDPPNFRPPDALSRIFIEDGARIYTNGGTVYALPTPENTLTISGHYATWEAAAAASEAAINAFAAAHPDAPYGITFESYGHYDTDAPLPHYIAERYIVETPVSHSAISATPLPGISVDDDGDDIDVPFSLLVQVGAQMALSPNDIWEMRPSSTGMRLTSDPIVHLANIEPGAGPPEASPSPDDLRSQRQGAMTTTTNKGGFLYLLAGLIDVPIGKPIKQVAAWLIGKAIEETSTEGLSGIADNMLNKTEPSLDPNYNPEQAAERVKYLDQLGIDWVGPQ